MDLLKGDSFVAHLVHNGGKCFAPRLDRVGPAKGKLFKFGPNGCYECLHILLSRHDGLPHQLFDLVVMLRVGVLKDQVLHLALDLVKP